MMFMIRCTNAAYYNAAKAYLSKSATYVEDGVPGGHYRVDEEIRQNYTL